MSRALPGMRVALYWAPAMDDPLHAAGSAWLGRDAETGATVRQPPLEGIAGATAAPALYGFHATLRPPMRLATGWAEFMQAAEVLARRTAAFAMPLLAPWDTGGALALGMTQDCLALQAFADACVMATDRHRLPPDAAELARRRSAGLSPAQEAMLGQWGYPYVMEEWFFHVTLTRRLAPDERAAMRQGAEAHFAASLAVKRVVREVCVFTQRAAGAPFLIAERLALKG